MHLRPGDATYQFMKNGVLCALLGQGGLDEENVAFLPGGLDALEGGAVVEALLGEAVIEVGDVELFGALGGPGLERGR